MPQLADPTWPQIPESVSMQTPALALPAAAIIICLSLAACGGTTAAGGQPPPSRGAATLAAVEPDPEAIFERACASCHADDASFGPTVSTLASRPAEAIAATLTTGSMRSMAAGLSTGEIRALAEHLSRAEDSDEGEMSGGFCEARDSPLALDAGDWNGWSRDLDNSRYNPAPGLSAADVGRLRVKWAFAYEGGALLSQPTLFGGRVFTGNLPGSIYSLDAETGCTYWQHALPGGVRAALSVGVLPDGRYAVYAGDDQSTIHALDAVTGAPLWSTQVETHPRSRITGSPVLHEGRLYVPVSSLEESAATSDDYECCTFRGSVVALDGASGEIAWKSYTIAEEPEPFQVNRAGGQMYGPAGGAIWSAPTLDAARGLLYAVTGNSYTEVPEDGSSSLLAFDLETGEIRWRHQFFVDNYIPGCGRSVPPANCPADAGPDFDFGATPVLRRLPDGRDVLILGNKGAYLYAVDVENPAEPLWRVRLGQGSALGGIQWGYAADGEFAYVPVADMLGPEAGRRTGMNKVRIATGEVLWHTPAPAPACSFVASFECSNALSAAATLIPGVVFAGSLDGHLRAFSTEDGSILWSFDTARLFRTANGPLAEGGSLDAGGATVVDGTLFLTSGYGRHPRRQPGNVLLAFTVDGR